MELVRGTTKRNDGGISSSISKQVCCLADAVTTEEKDNQKYLEKRFEGFKQAFSAAEE